MKSLLGKKLGMMHVYDAKGTMIPVTVLEVGPCTVIQVKTSERDRSRAVQIGFEPLKTAPGREKALEKEADKVRKEQPAHGSKVKGRWEARKLPKCPYKNVNRPMWGHLFNAGITAYRRLRDVRIDPKEEIAIGQVFTVDELFKPGQHVDVTGTSIGKGFQGVMARHNFKGVGEATHGQSDRLRAPGSIGGSSYPARVFKGQRMAGHTGDVQITSKNLLVVQVIPDRHLLLVKGSVVGATNSYIMVRHTTR